jgi:hypothetical protein
MCDPWVQTPCFDLRHLRPRPTRWSGQKSTSPVTDAQIIAPTNGSATPILDTARTNTQIIAPTNGSATPILDTARKRAQIGAATNGSATPILDTARTNAHIVAPTTGSTPVVVSTGGGRSGHWDERGSQDSTGSHGETDCATATVATLLDHADTGVVVTHGFPHIHGSLDHYVADRPRHGVARRR